ncbi:dendrin [Corapipo altera]|uniref:dendrin n=1 Tax=Corapipo altera TaxID=415028 RepID=UPI000FD6889C|nr:dendrin [Corapipo altera]
MLGGPERGAGRLRICERTKLVLVEIDTVACCSSGAGMAAGCRPEPPWTYRRIAGEYAYLEKRFVAELAPPLAPRAPQFLPTPAGLRPPAPGAPHPLPPTTARGDGGQRTLGGEPTAHAPASGAGGQVVPPHLRGAHAAGAGTPRHCQTLPRAAAGRERVPGRGRGRRGSGGHVLIDATRVVVRAQYVPPPQRQQVRYTGGSPAPTSPPRSPPAPPGALTPPAAPSPPREPTGSPHSPWRSPGGCGGPRGRPPPRRPVLYAQALREAVSRIRRHTAPDSDSEAEGSVGGSRRRLCRDPHAYSSSSSSLESTGAPPGPTSPTRA